MKFNKIIALSTCAMMAFSAVASAAGNVYLDGEYATITNVPTMEEVAARTPLITAKITSFANQDAAKADGAAFGRKDNFSADAYDFYKMEVTINNFGDLIYGTDATADYVPVEIQLYDVSADFLGLKASEVKTYDVAGSTLSDTLLWDKLTTLESGDLSYHWGNLTKYPTYTNASLGAIDDNKLAVKVAHYYVVPEGAKYEVTPKFLASYSYKYSADESERILTAEATGYTVKCINDGVESNKIVLGAAAPVVKDIAIEATAEKTTATGCIWNVALTNAAKINEFKATFKADGAEDAVRYIRNIADVASAVSGEGSLNFQVGVLTNTTTKTGIKAAFDVKDSDGKTASTGDVAAAAVAE